MNKEDYETNQRRVMKITKWPAAEAGNGFRGYRLHNKNISA